MQAGPGPSDDSSGDRWELPAEWESLCRAGNAHPLFMRRDWLESWYAAHADEFALDVHLIKAGGPGTGLTGILPMTRRRAVHRLGLRGQRLELLGHLWRAPGVMSEFLDAAVSGNESGGQPGALTRGLLGLSWDDCVFSNVAEDAFVVRELVPRLGDAGVYVRRCDPMDAWAISIDGGFGDFVSGLRSSLRRQLAGGRRKLAELGPVEIEAVSPGDEPGFFAVLNALHAGRWGRPALQGRHLDLHQAFAARLNASSQAWLGVVRLAEKPLAALYDLRLGDTQYNIQMGFDAGVGRGLSPGYLGLGYAIEAACEHGLKRYDFLGGRGRVSDYKARFGGHRTRLASWHLVRTPPLKWLYRAYDRFRRR